MSILLRRAKRDYHQEHRSLIGRSVNTQDDTVAHTQLHGVPSVKPTKAGWKKWFAWAKKSQSMVQGPSIDSAEVTTSFLVHQLGMVAAENVAVDTQETPKSAEIQASENVTFPQTSGDSSKWLRVRDSVATNATDILESLWFLFIEPSEVVTASEQERTRDSMDSDGSTWNTRSGSPISEVDTAASTPPSTQGERKSICETSIDVPIFRAYHDGRNRLVTSDVDIPVVKEQDQVSNKQISADVPEVDHAQEAAPAHEMVQISDSVPNLERAVSPPLTNAAEPLTATAAGSVESAHVSVTLDTKEIEAASSRQISNRRGGNTGRRRRKTTKSGTDGHKKAFCNLKRIIMRRSHTHAADKQKTQQELASLEEANALLERRNTNLGNTNFQQHKAFALLQDRMLELEDQNLNDNPLTIAELNKVVKLLKEKITQLEESNMQMVMKVTREYDDYKQGQKGKVETLEAKIERTQEELAYAIEARDEFEQPLSEALARQNPTDQQTVSAFEAREKTLKQENENSARVLEEETKKRKESEQLATDLRISCRKVERVLHEAKEQITTLTSANKLLEARAEPIDFVGLPPQQRNEMAQMQQVIADLTEELRRAKELLNKVSKAKLGQVQSIILEDRDHHYETYIARIEEQSDRITDLTNKLWILERTMRHDQGLAFAVQEENEELKISLNAVTNDLKAFREKQAGGDCSLVDPRSWQHMKECSEGREQAILRQQKAEGHLEQVQEEYKTYKEEAATVATNLWLRIWRFEGLIDPSQCPYYLTDDRETLVNSSGDVFELDVNWKCQKDEFDLEAQDLRNYGCYRGPKGTPDAWLPVAQSSTNSSISGSVAGASINASVDRSNDVQASSDSSRTGSAVGNAIETLAEAFAAGPKSQNPADLQKYIAVQNKWIGRIQIHAVFLWARIWEFEAIVAPEECDPRVWNMRKGLVRRTWKYANFDANHINSESEVGVPEPHGPLHTPDAWMPETDDLEGEDENDSVDGIDDDDDYDVDDGGNDDGDENGGCSVVANDANALDSSEDVPDQPSTGTASQQSSTGAPTQNQIATYITNNSPTTSASGSPTPTIPSSSIATPSELDTQALLLTSNPQVLDDHRLAQHLAANPHLLNLPDSSNIFEEPEPGSGLTGAKEQWVSRQPYKELDSSKLKNKGLDPGMYTNT